ncbi:MAG TPA: methyltransferase domain-containing protein [Vicinamibacterales bacterium]|nr:methyltransferase domain-containing protein [Vicinamibacterales bacterium]
MKDLLRRVLHRATTALLRPLEDQARARQRELIGRIERLEKRVDSALAKGQAESRLLAARIDAGRARPSKLSRRLVARAASRVDRVDGVDAHPIFPQDVATLTACSVCGHREWTAVCEYNRFLLIDAPDEEAVRADYALCHHCGVVFARRRPVGARFRALVDQFEETIGRTLSVGHGPKLLSSHRLSESDVAKLKARAAHPVFVSEVPRVRDRQHMPQLMRDRLTAAAHIEILGSLLTLRAPRVLEIRPRFGAIGASLRRLYGGETAALPLFEVQQVLVREVYGTRADHLLDYDRLSIPYEGRFDLVVANHLLTHAVRPDEALSVIREKLNPGGHLYLYNEPDEGDFLDTGKSIFNTLNAFHLQTFNGASLARVLQSAGFDPVFIGHHQDNCIALARAVSRPVVWDPISPKELANRVARYERARDRSILMLADSLRGRFASEWEAVVERGFAAKIVDFDDDGHLRLVKKEK